jgi:hypothetical protein
MVFLLIDEGEKNGCRPSGAGRMDPPRDESNPEGFGMLVEIDLTSGSANLSIRESPRRKFFLHSTFQ